MKKISFLSMMMLAVVVLPLMVACGDDDDDVFDTTPIRMLSNGEKTISGAETITSTNEFVAYAKDNKVMAFHVGDTELIVNGKYKIPLTVSPLYNLYDDPVCDWGCSMEYVKKHQKQGALSSKSSSTLLAYENAGGASVMGYSFENGKLKSAIALVSTSHASTLVDYLLERYLIAPYYKGSETYYVGFDGLSEEKANTAILMQVYSASMISVVYTSVKTSSARGDFSNNSDEDLKDYTKELSRLFLPE